MQQIKERLRQCVSGNQILVKIVNQSKYLLVLRDENDLNVFKEHVSKEFPRTSIKGDIIKIFNNTKLKVLYFKFPQIDISSWVSFLILHQQYLLPKNIFRIDNKQLFETLHQKQQHYFNKFNQEMNQMKPVLKGAIGEDIIQETMILTGISAAYFYLTQKIVPIDGIIYNVDDNFSEFSPPYVLEILNQHQSKQQVKHQQKTYTFITLENSYGYQFYQQVTKKTKVIHIQYVLQSLCREIINNPENTQFEKLYWSLSNKYLQKTAKYWQNVSVFKFSKYK